MTLTPEQVKRARAAAIRQGLPTLHEVIHDVCDMMGAKVADVKAKRRTQFLDAVRLEIYLCAREAGFSFPKIARVMDRHHSTILKVIAGAKRLPDNENSTKMKAGRNAVDAAPDPDRNRDTMEVRDNG